MINKSHVLIIDDNKEFYKNISKYYNHNDLNFSILSSLKNCVSKIKSLDCDIVIINEKMPDGNGIEMIQKIRETQYSPEVIIISEDAKPESAEKAINMGASDYLQKKSLISEHIEAIELCIRFRKQLLSEKSSNLKRNGIIGASNIIKTCLRKVYLAAQSNVNVLITGKTGTGKELFSNAIHDNSSRSKNNFVVVDCTAIPDNIFESMIFGHKKGSFTGALTDTDGLIKQANNGTLFLDEVGELSLSFQKKFLRVLQEQKFRPVGSNKEIYSNFRLITATNKDLFQMAKDGVFRTDLLFRLSAFSISLPTLKERKEDIIKLANYHLDRMCKLYQIPCKKISPSVTDCLKQYHWPGNVRELVNTIDYILTVARNHSTILPYHLPKSIRIQLTCNALRNNVPEDTKIEISDDKSNIPNFKDYCKKIKKQAEINYLNHISHLFNGNIKKMCNVSGLSRSHIYNLFKKNNIVNNSN